MVITKVQLIASHEQAKRLVHFLVSYRIEFSFSSIESRATFEIPEIDIGTLKVLTAYLVSENEK